MSGNIRKVLVHSSSDQMPIHRFDRLVCRLVQCVCRWEEAYCGLILKKSSKFEATWSAREIPTLTMLVCNLHRPRYLLTILPRHARNYYTGGPRSIPICTRYDTTSSSQRSRPVSSSSSQQSKLAFRITHSPVRTRTRTFLGVPWPSFVTSGGDDKDEKKMDGSGHRYHERKILP